MDLVEAVDGGLRPGEQEDVSRVHVDALDGCGRVEGEGGAGEMLEAHLAHACMHAYIHKIYLVRVRVKG